MAKFEKFEPRKQIRGLAEAARQIQIEDLIRDGKMAGGPGSGFWYPGLGLSASCPLLPDY